MKLDAIEIGLSKLLQVEKPWVIKSINLQPKNKVIDIVIDYERGSVFPCCECGELCKVHDGSYHRIRHLDWFEYRSYLNIKTPRTKCEKHGVRVIDKLPWGNTGSHFSFLFEHKVMRLSTEMTMNAIGLEYGEPDSNLWRLFKKQVARAIN